MTRICQRVSQLGSNVLFPSVKTLSQSSAKKLSRQAPIRASGGHRCTTQANKPTVLITVTKLVSITLSLHSSSTTEQTLGSVEEDCLASDESDTTSRFELVNGRSET